MQLIECQGINKSYKLGDLSLDVLRDVCFSVARGEYVALTGASGSGKSTLMNIIGLLDRATAGKYLLDGTDAAELSNDELAVLRNQKIGFVFQNFNLLSRTSALDNVILPLLYAPHDLGRRQAQAQAEEMLRLVGLGDRLDHHPSQLSGGQQQRVAIARALINRPPLILADEPTGNLDSQTSKEIMTIFRELNEQEGMTLVLVTHDPDIARHADRIIHIRDGKVSARDYNAAASGRDLRAEEKA